MEKIKMTKKIREALKNNGIKGYSRALIMLDTGYVIVGDYSGKIDYTFNRIVFHNIDLSIKGCFAVEL